MLYSILIHWPAQVVDAMDAYLSQLDPSVDVIFAYGGPPEEFVRIQTPRKLFIDEPSLRGALHLQNYPEFRTLRPF